MVYNIFSKNDIVLRSTTLGKDMLARRQTLVSKCPSLYTHTRVRSRVHSLTYTRWRPSIINGFFLSLGRQFVDAQTMEIIQ